MRKQFLLFLTILFSAFTFGQTKGVKIGYIDMEYILQNVPSYTEAKNQLELKAQKWKQEIEVRNNEITKLKEALKTEQVLLTKELIAEKQEEINFQEKELLDYNQKRFGPNGDLLNQKSILVKPIQDQIFTIVQDLADSKKYDFIFDKSSDLTMLFSAKRHDISDQVVRAITRAERREQLSKKELKEQEKKEYQEDVEDENPALAARKKALEDKKAARDKLMEDRKLAAEAKKKAQDDKRKELLEAREAKKSGTVPANDKITEDKTATPDNKKVSDSSAVDPNSKEAKAAARAKLIEDKKKALDEKRKKILADREAAKKAKEDKTGEPKTEE